MPLDTQSIQTLSAALSAENLSFSTFALMNSVQAEPSPLSLAQVAIRTGYSYWAVWNQIERTQWFMKARGESGLVCLSLTEEAETKLARIAARLTRAA
jgi:hypothetical protein